MRQGFTVAVVIPALNEEEAIGKVLSSIPEWVDDVVVADNGSTDHTAEVALARGARVVTEPRRGYGSACRAALAALRSPDIVVFLDGDFSDNPQEMQLLVDPIARGQADMVIGSRVLGCRESGALTVQARFGNWLTCLLLRVFWRAHHTDLGPFRAVRSSALRLMKVQDPDYGWTVEMQIKAACLGLRAIEVPISYRRRIGKSKISGTVKGVVGAGIKILYTVFFALLHGQRYGTEGLQERLVIFSRYPWPGKTKTRLIPVLGPEPASDVQRQMTAHTLAHARMLSLRRGTQIEVCFADSDDTQMRSWLGTDLLYRPQCSGDLGTRMANAIDDAFLRGADAVVLVGTDCPGDTADIMEEAFCALRRCDLVLGPSTDGGYYLIGLRCPAPQLFEDIAWGGPDVLQRTLGSTKSMGLSVTLIEPQVDVDRPEDLPVWERARETSPARFAGMKISVIIPTLNEAAQLEKTIASVRTAQGIEVVVVDGGSQDGTPDVARSLEARVISVPPERSRQMNTGAAAASGQILLFLHADTELPPHFDEHVRWTLAGPGVVAGAFRFSIGDRSAGLRIVERLANWRSRTLHMPYGDQGFFLKADLFRRLGGFPDIPLMEDFELVRRLRREGTVAIAPVSVVTSGRRWLRQGTLKTTLFNQMIIVGYLLGISPRLLAKWFRS